MQRVIGLQMDQEQPRVPCRCVQSRFQDRDINQSKILCDSFSGSHFTKSYKNGLSWVSGLMRRPSDSNLVPIDFQANVDEFASNVP